ncbi:hypothetical protein BJF83_23195 [Nocardiopsis sp. CNR-923]|nr:hypothetical protein BJF83_23195 [Nocardiopsis sp. CNR-923]
MTRAGHLIDPLWHRAVLAVDRAHFIPDTVWITSRDHPGYFEPITRADARFAEWAHQDYALAVQVDDGTPAGGPNGEAGWGRLRTSSISQPSLVVAMLQALDACDGHRVLEIGTGTGYNTALLCHALTERAVVSTEIDPALAAVAVDNLARVGYTPTVLAMDGVGLPVSGVDMGDFHRLIATVAARGSIPHSWVRQVHPGGVIVTPYEAGQAAGVLVRLEVGDDETAHGRIIGPAPFMVLRQHRPDRRPLREIVDETAPGVAAGHTDLNPRVLTYPHQGWQLVLGHLVPDLRHAVYEADPDRPEWAGQASVYVAAPDGSWALAEYTPAGGPFETARHGPDDLWTRIAAAWNTWCTAGRPTTERLGVSVDADGTRLWADTPDHVLRSYGAAPSTVTAG